MTIKDVITDIAQRIRDSAGVKTVYGEPITAGSRPVKWCKSASSC